MANPLAPDADGWDQPVRPMGPWEAQFAQYLQPDPNTTYGSVLPIARDNTTGALRLALPSSVRDLAQGALQLLDGPATGTVTPQATMALASLPVASGLAAGADATGNALASGPIVAYHGSPYDFDAFDAGKIGTGEGAQAYGHGLYFAENEDVAKSYRDKLSANNQVPVTIPSPFGPVSVLEKDASRPGRMYQVALNADPDTLLDWDKPLSEQPQGVQDLVAQTQAQRAAAEKYRPLQLSDIKRDSQGNPVGPGTGGQAYQYLAAPRYGATPEAVASSLNQAGIPGIKYLDAGSRAAGGGTHNYVMFDPATIAILRKYGLAAMLAGGGADAVANAPKQGS